MELLSSASLSPPSPSLSLFTPLAYQADDDVQYIFTESGEGQFFGHGRDFYPWKSRELCKRIIKHLQE